MDTLPYFCRIYKILEKQCIDLFSIVVIDDQCLDQPNATYSDLIYTIVPTIESLAKALHKELAQTDLAKSRVDPELQEFNAKEHFDYQALAFLDQALGLSTKQVKINSELVALSEESGNRILTPLLNAHKSEHAAEAAEAEAAARTAAKAAEKAKAKAEEAAAKAKASAEAATKASDATEATTKAEAKAEAAAKAKEAKSAANAAANAATKAAQLKQLKQQQKQKGLISLVIARFGLKPTKTTNMTKQTRGKTPPTVLQLKPYLRLSVLPSYFLLSQELCHSTKRDRSPSSTLPLALSSLPQPTLTRPLIGLAFLKTPQIL